MKWETKIQLFTIACGFSSLVIEPSKAWLVQLSRDLAKVKMAPLGALVEFGSMGKYTHHEMYYRYKKCS